MKTLLLTSFAALMLSVGAASADPWNVDAYGNPLPSPSVSQRSVPAGHFIDYGTGYYGRGSATGGPSGGLPDRN